MNPPQAKTKNPMNAKFFQAALGLALGATAMRLAAAEVPGPVNAYQGASVAAFFTGFNDVGVANNTVVAAAIIANHQTRGEIKS